MNLLHVRGGIEKTRNHLFEIRNAITLRILRRGSRSASMKPSHVVKYKSNIYQKVSIAYIKTE